MTHGCIQSMIPMFLLIWGPTRVTEWIGIGSYLSSFTHYHRTLLTPWYLLSRQERRTTVVPETLTPNLIKILYESHFCCRPLLWRSGFKVLTRVRVSYLYVIRRTSSVFVLPDESPSFVSHTHRPLLHTSGDIILLTRNFLRFVF